MFDTVTTVLALALIFIGLPVLILRMNDRQRSARRRRDHPAASDIRERQAYEQRLLNPDWACVERHLRRPAPQALRELYSDRALITPQDLNYTAEQVISTFEALDEEAIQDMTRWLGFEAVAIATTDFGDAVYLRPGLTEVDTVYLTHHDGGDTEVFAESVTQMLAALRQAHPRR
jgi:hypothetical protein